MQRGACIDCKSIVILLGQLLAMSVIKRLVNDLVKSLVKAARVMGMAGVLIAPVATAAEPACDSGPYRDFDFWLGHWNVHLADGRLAGENRIEASGDGCRLVERWRGARGSEGFSLNFYEPADDRWRQIWVSSDNIIEISGGLIGGSMVLEGEIRYRRPVDGGRADASGPRRPFRGTWTPLGDGRVRQFFEEWRADEAGREGWQTWFEGFYGKVVE